ncbi:competence protein CoiA family protein [Dyadobacter sp. 3J3]|uniref:competence protein CoiA family protein n=1 Tax=Dyadobacter sp. 3J3 TaxID=2606600 RepID=UPI00135AC6BD|nr:competence protein CoiA family protein [Dyadobacter sp. 3J3]
MKEQYDHDDHSWALDLQDRIRHISQVDRGRKGYFCTGCRQRMIAKKGEINKPHFAHDPQDKSKSGKCTYSEETFRHKLGKEILQRLKQIKVPSLRKYPSEGQNGSVNIIRDSWVVEADTVAIEMPFFENENGQIIWGKNPEWKTDTAKHLMIQPDITFFDSAGKPILLIELVATHKINDDKHQRIRNLGLDTIQVSLPNGPSEEIEETFTKTTRTKWVYNYERESTEYQYVPLRASEEVSFGDEFEERLVKFERTFECKIFEINEAIRRFRRHLESEQFTSARESINIKIRRTERNTTAARKQWRELQARIEGEVSEGFESERVRLDEIESNFILADSRFRAKYADLEERYKRKDRELKIEERTYRSTSQHEIDELEERIRESGADPEPLSDRIAKLRADEGKFEQSIRTEEGNIESQTEVTIGKIATTDGEIQRIEQQMAGFPDESDELETKVRKEIETRENGFREELGRAESNLRGDIDRLGEISAGAIKNRDFKRTPRLNRQIKELVEAGGLLDTIPVAAKLYERLQAARKELNTGSYKTWI